MTSTKMLRTKKFIGLVLLKKLAIMVIFFNFAACESQTQLYLLQEKANVKTFTT